MCPYKVFPCALLAALFVSTISVLAEDKPAQISNGYLPSLGDLMSAVQLRHSKLFYAARLKNWALADYELSQLNLGLKASRAYSDMPFDLTAMDKVMLLLDESIKAKNEVRFELHFGHMTSECNHCHQVASRAFIYVRRPAFPSPFSNQVFGPLGR